MVFKRVEDGKCVVCKKFADHMCDSCGIFVCKNHWFVEKADVGMTERICCPRCWKERQSRRK